ncbi:putative S-adenosyl-L-methionine-dependent methyltransferase [Helianthus anomalus]
MRGRPDGSQKKRLLNTFVLLGAILLFLYLYSGSHSEGESAIEYGSRSLRKLGSSYLGGDDESDLGRKQDEFKFRLDEEDGIVAKSFPMRLKLDLSLMDQYERHCPLSERHFNCLILYKVLHLHDHTVK